MTTFSANLGFLWTDRSLPDAILAAKQHGFAAVECHWPYQTPASSVAAALDETNLIMLGLNTSRGDVSQGENGLSALPGREVEARAAIDQAITYAAAINTPNIHVMAGFAQGAKAHQTFVNNLHYATEQARCHDMTILIEPLNHYDAPGYFLNTSAQAKAIIKQINKDNLKLMFDCYHIQIMEGDITRRLTDLLDIIGHIQIASVPLRQEPDGGELDYRHVLGVLAELGFHRPIGAEYRPKGRVEAGLNWMNALEHD